MRAGGQGRRRVAARRLGPDEEALWARVRATVRAMPGRKAAAPSPERLPLPAPAKGMTVAGVPTPPPSHARREPGHTLASAHAALEMGLGQALMHGDRVILLITGKPPRPESQRPHARGAIRAAIPDWLRLSAFSGAIAAVRNAHPRHGGAGALYVVLRRRR